MFAENPGMGDSSGEVHGEDDAVQKLSVVQSTWRRGASFTSYIRRNRTNRPMVALLPLSPGETGGDILAWTVIARAVSG